MLSTFADATRMIVVAVIAAIAMTCAVPAAASAAEVLGGNYSSSALTLSDGTAYTCAVWSAGTDGNGNSYMPCGGYIAVVDKYGNRVNSIDLPDDLPTRRDVAATDDGNTIYYVSGWQIVDLLNPYALYPNIGKVVKMVRGVDGVFRQDTAFNVGQVLLAGNKWSARNLDVDSAGRVYFTVNAFVYIHNSQGLLLDYFGGDDQWSPTGTYLGGIENAQGITVSNDGNKVYVVEQMHNHVQRWDRGVSGHFSRSAWRLGSLTQVSDCIDDFTFASPYDVALDGSGFIYVLDVSCRRIQKYDAATGAFNSTLWQFYNPVGDAEKYHGFSVDYRGTVIIPEKSRRYTQALVSGRCLPDYDAPTIPTVTTKSVVWNRKVTIGFKAADHCSSIKSFAVSGDLSPLGWRPVTSSFTTTLSNGDGVKNVDIAVKDAYGRVGIRRVSIKLDTTQPPLIVRRVVNLWGRNRFCYANPMAMIGNASAYRLLDRCATVTGTLEKIEKYKGAKVLTIRLSLATSQRLYTNARIPAQMISVGVVRVPRNRPLRVGRPAIITGALIMNKRGNSVTVAPVGNWYGS